jgi:hypothetical protein
MDSSSGAKVRKIKVVIGLPGNRFSDSFLICWTQCLAELIRNDEFEIIVSAGYSSFVSFARMKTLGLDVLRGHDQKPFNDSDYDVFLTIDSDIVFNAAQVKEMINGALSHGVVSGMYMMANGKHLAAVREWDENHFVANGSFKFLTPKEVEEWLKDEKRKEGDKYMEVSYAGMGFFAATKEVLNTLEYPYFWHPLIEIQGPDGKVYRDQCSEDVAFCRNLQAKGHKIFLHTGLRVGHEKSLVL